MSETSDKKVSCCIISPTHQAKFFKLFADRCFKDSKEAHLEYELYKYEGLSRNNIQRIKAHLQENCILILGYDETSFMPFYKLGLAHAHGRHAIILILESDSNTFNIPKCIGNTFWIPICPEKLKEHDIFQILINRVRKLAMMILEGDLKELLYQEACEICDSESRSNSYPISKVSKEEFLHRISRENLSPLFADYDELHQFLLQKIVFDQHVLVYLSLNQPRPKSQIPSQANDNDRLNIIIHTGDRVGGDKVGQDKVGGNKTQYP